MEKSVSQLQTTNIKRPLNSSKFSLKVFNLSFLEEEKLLEELMNDPNYTVQIKSENWDQLGHYRIAAWITKVMPHPKEEDKKEIRTEHQE